MKRFVFIISFPTIMNFVMISKKTKADDSAFAIHGSNQRAKQNLLFDGGTVAAGSAEADFPDQCFQNRSFQFPAVFERADGSQRVPQLQERLRECLRCKFLLKIFREDLFQQFIIFFLKGSQRGISALKRGAPVMFSAGSGIFFCFRRDLSTPGNKDGRCQQHRLKSGNSDDLLFHRGSFGAAVLITTVLVDFVKYIIFACFQVLKSKNIYFFNIHNCKGSVYGRGFLFPNLISNRSCILLKTQAAFVCGSRTGR
ncbi:hypothetical protein FYJ85_16285 [Victivallaceae bacterium BBE-744-WT-12]|uniref:Uncharacterized protein n=1 Tax=Victivallis lenta TaxID=2606640 RepID=A0A844G834_9BACT|nr:hypothetical protein [Victivallis lenta]MST98598.1 hypothetical protein [Victivallis lenta]